MSSFKEQFTVAQRTLESSRILLKYPHRIPIIVEKIKNSLAPDIDKHKYLVPEDLTVGHFIHVIRKRIKILPDQALFIFVNNGLPPTSQLISKVYAENKEECGFLFVKYGIEDCFGSF